MSNSNLKKYVAYDPVTFEFQGFYQENRKDLPETIAEVDPDTYLADKGEHTHYNPETGLFYTAPPVVDPLLEAKKNRQWRDRILKETDMYVLVDFPITALNLLDIKTYRQELRDYPLTWVRPTPPAFLED